MFQLQGFPGLVAADPSHERCPAHRLLIAEMGERLRQHLPPQVFQSPSNWSGSLSSRCQKSLLPLLPLVKWELSDHVPAHLSVFILTRCGHESVQVDFAREMLEHWTIPGKHLRFLQLRNCSLKFAEGVTVPLLAIEMDFVVETERDLLIIRRDLPSLVEEIRLGLRSPSAARHILEGKGLSAHQKFSQVSENLIQRSQRFPRYFNGAAFRELQHLRLQTDDDFVQLRSVGHLSRVLSTWHCFRHQMIASLATQPDTRQIYVKYWPTYLEFPYGLKRVWSFVIGLNFLKKHEHLDDEHLLQAIGRCMDQTATMVPGSFISFREKGDPMAAFYLEVEEEQLPTNQVFRERLVKEIEGSIETLVRSVFMKRNDEEVYQNILLLGQELRYVSDRPQVVVSYVGQGERDLHFSVILARIKRADSKPVDKILSKLPAGVRLVPEQVRTVGTLRKRYPKEATVFTLKIDKHEFFRRDHSVDLYKARIFVISLLDDRFGGIRDYNGGLILRQNESLQRVKKKLENDLHDECLLENFFYSLTPALMQTTLSSGVIQKLFLLFLEVLHGSVPAKDKYVLRSQVEDGAVYVVVRAEDAAFRDHIYRSLDRWDTGNHVFASSAVDSHGAYTFACVYQGTDLEVFRAVIEQGVQEWTKRCRETQCLRINCSNLTPVLDPRRCTSRISGTLIKMLYEGLMRVGEDGEAHLGLAKQVHASYDHTHFTFVLREAQWTDGQAVTAADFEYAWRKVLDPKVDSRFSYLFYCLKNARAAKKGFVPLDAVGVKAVDAHTLEVELEHPTPYFLHLVAHWSFSPLCRQVERDHPGWAHYGTAGFVGNGPFRLAQWNRDSGLRFVKSPTYWDAENVKLHQIDLTMVKDPRAVVDLFHEGRLDWIGHPLGDLPADKVPGLLETGTLASREVAVVYQYNFNVCMFPFTSKALRQAFAYAINRQQLIDEVMYGDEQVTTSVLPPCMWLQQEPYFEDGNVEVARHLFQKGCEELQLDPADFPVITISYSHEEREGEIADLVVKQWEEAFGITVRTQSYDREDYLTRVSRKEFQVVAINWHSWVTDPMYNLEHMIEKEYGVSATAWEHPAYRRLIDKAGRTLDPAMRRDWMHQAEKLLMDDMPCSPLFTYKYRYATRPHVKGVVITQTGQIDFRWAHLQEED